MKRQEQTAEQRAEFWRECGILVYLPLCAVGVAGVLVFVGPQLGWLVAVIFLPGVYVQAMMSRRHQQYMQEAGTYWQPMTERRA